MRHQKIRMLAMLLTCALTACKSPPATTVTVFGLWPEQPPLRYKPIDIWFGGGNCYVWPRLDATRLKLRWCVFPRPVDRSTETNSIFAQVRSVTYDLRIWRGLSENQVADELVYAREALPNPFHQVEVSLPRSAWYFWSVRARFELNGQIRVTEWSYIASPQPTPRSNPPRAGINYPDPRYYRFYLR